MASIIAGAAHTAHSTAASLLSSAQIHPGKTLPPLKVKETSPERAEIVQLSGTTIIVDVPGAFTGTCSVQIPGYVDNYEAFKAKGVTGIYVVAVNDQFVMKSFDCCSTTIHFLADDQGEFAGATGLIFDATPLLGGPRSKRYVMIVKNQEVASVAVEEDSGKVTITDAKTILAQL
ncbi:Redoxin [Armillaria gallica]|uniref:Redoxin n=1 Tax=Armillaria gallica TaxID=47427 RepID=A0A2H3CK51_ARMGA|nr:Redoxin [Armillaria gallica]